MFNKRVGVFYHNFKNSLIIHEQIPNHSSEIGHMYSSLYLHKVSSFLKAFVGFWFQSQGKGGFEK
jgi:hypothetical protein